MNGEQGDEHTGHGEEFADILRLPDGPWGDLHSHDINSDCCSSNQRR